jgi:hypothetical protein
MSSQRVLWDDAARSRQPIREPTNQAEQDEAYKNNTQGHQNLTACHFRSPRFELTLGHGLASCKRSVVG